MGADWVRRREVTALLSSLKISDQLTQAAFEVAGGAPDIAVNMILEHRRVLEASFASEVSAPSTGTEFPPVIAGIVEALVEANSELAGASCCLHSNSGICSTVWGL